MEPSNKSTAPPTQERILLVDDDRIILDSLGEFLEAEGYDVTRAETVARATDCLQGSRYALVITDISMPSGDGLALLKYARAHHPDVMVIIVTAYGTIESAVEAIKQGAYDYLTKPIIDDDVRMAVRRAIEQRKLLAENQQLKRALCDRGSFENIVAADFRMAKVFDLIDAVADTQTTVLITGESGTGKSLVARAIHAHSPRRDGAFVEVACGALPETLLESELFGHARGAFTGAISDKPGKFAAAQGGTIFLDEIATASPQLQVKLLRVLQERRFEPVGSNETRQADVRVILATNMDLQRAVAKGEFREDLYYRINVVNVALPPLRERVGDIPLLAEHFLRKYRDATGKAVDGFLMEAIDAMQRYGWPGNVRELENCVERAVVLCRERMIGVGDLPPAVVAGAGEPALTVDVDTPRTLAEMLEGPEKQIISTVLKARGQSRRETAKHLGINRTTLYKKMKKYGLL